jgi:hypothetical protein
MTISSESSSNHEQVHFNSGARWVRVFFASTSAAKNIQNSPPDWKAVE